MRELEVIEQPIPLPPVPAENLSTWEGVLIGLASLALGHFLKPMIVVLVDQFKRDSMASERFSDYLTKQLEAHESERELYFSSVMELQQQAKLDREACAREREQFLRHLDSCGEVMQGFSISLGQVSQELSNLSSQISGNPGTSIYQPKMPKNYGETDSDRPPGAEFTRGPNRPPNYRVSGYPEKDSNRF